jgi:hypothetical protein
MLTIAQLGAAMLVGAMFGAVEITISHIVNGGGPDQLLEKVLISAGIGAAVGLATAGLFKGFGKFGTLFGSRFGSTSAATGILGSIGKALMPVIKFGMNVVRLGLVAKTGQTLAQMIMSSSQFYGSAIIPVGVPPWVLADGGSGPPRAEAPLLNTMPLAP